MSPHYDFDASRFQKGCHRPVKSLLGKVRENVVELVRMFACIAIDFHGAFKGLPAAPVPESGTTVITKRARRGSSSRYAGE